MFVDASAVVAILAGEPDGAHLAARLARAPHVLVSPIVLFETAAALTRIFRCSVADARAYADRFVEETGAEVVAIDKTIGMHAIGAFDRYGKGRHAAALNMGDCYTYACAVARGAPVLFKGNDFTQTDLGVA